MSMSIQQFTVGVIVRQAFHAVVAVRKSHPAAFLPRMTAGFQASGVFGGVVPAVFMASLLPTPVVDHDFNSQDSNSGVLHCSLVISHSPSEKMILGWTWFTTSLNCGNMCSAT